MCWALLQTCLFAQTNAPRIISVEPGQPAGAEVHRHGADPARWDSASTDPRYSSLYPGDRLRVTDKGRAAVLWTDNTIYRLARGGELEVPETADGTLVARLLRGIAYFFHRDRPGAIRVESPTVSLTVRGTEFSVDVAEDGKTTVGVIEGEVLITNAFSTLVLRKGESGIADSNGKLQLSTAINATNLVQWCLYYPAVLYLGDLRLSPIEQTTLEESIRAYKSGDLPKALGQYTANRQPASQDERLFLASLRLSVGQVQECITILDGFQAQKETDDRLKRIGEALKLLISAVKGRRLDRQMAPTLATEWLAESYYQQSRAGEASAEPQLAWESQSYGTHASADQSLRNARKAAEIATTTAPDFDFAWVRLAELQFSFGQIKSARQSLGRFMSHSVRNAQAFALQGFLSAGQNNLSEAADAFNRAILLDNGLANGWLGRGLVEIRAGRVEDGRRDLEIAAAMEPQRALLRSYLGKAYYEAAVFTANPIESLRHIFASPNYGAESVERANNELTIARQLDPQDPTPLLYSALMKDRENRVNQAVQDLEESVRLNDNRAVYRSRLLLDQDRSVRSANLAAIYSDAGLQDWSLNEAARAISDDYANYSAHEFLANSYNSLTDPDLVTLRYETVAFSEYLLSSLLSPVGSVQLSPTVSQNEYSRLFEADRLGLFSSTFYRSDGIISQNASQFGSLGKTDWAFDAGYQHITKAGPNDELEHFAFSARIKEQILPQAVGYFEVDYDHRRAGDVLEHYDPYVPTFGADPGDATHPLGSDPSLRLKEEQAPNLFAGMRYEWQPGVSSLFLFSRISDNFDLRLSDLPINAFQLNSFGTITDTFNASEFGANYNTPLFTNHLASQFVAYGFELQQIFEADTLTAVLGARANFGTVRTESQLTINPFAIAGSEFPFPPNQQQNETDFERFSVYEYTTWKPMPQLLLTAGLTYDWLSYPRNVNSPPVSAGQARTDKVSPKAGFVWTPLKDTTIRGAFTRSLGGLFQDASVRLEPTQVAGFNQAYRSLIPESLEGTIAGASFETFDLNVSQRFLGATYAGVTIAFLRSDAERELGALAFTPSSPNVSTPWHIPEVLKFQEPSLAVYMNRLVGNYWSFGGRYTLTKDELRTSLPSVPGGLMVPNATLRRSLFQQLDLTASFYHSSGWFATATGRWTSQHNEADVSQLTSSPFWELNLSGGLRFFHRRAEASIALLNLTDNDYRLYPLNPYAELPRKRAVAIQFTLLL